MPERHREHRAYRRTPKTTQRKRDRSEWIAVPVPAILDRDTFDRAQVRLKENVRLAIRNNKRHRYLLRSLLRCAKCGKAYSGGPSGPRTYYFCTASKSHSPYTGEKCDARAVRTERIDPVVWDSVVELLHNPEIIIRQQERRQTAQATDRASMGKRRKALDAQAKKLDAEEMRVVRLYREDKIDTHLLDLQLAEIRIKRAQVLRDLDQCHSTETDLRARAGQEDNIRTVCAEMSRGLAEMTFEEKQKIMRRLIDRIEVEPDGDRGMLFGVLPLPKQTDALCPSYL